MDNSKTISITNLKKKALESLKGNWGLAIGTTLLGGILLALPSILSGALTFGSTMRMISELGQRSTSYGYNSYDYSRMSDYQGSSYSGLSLILSLLITGAVSYGIIKFNLNLIRDNRPKVEDVFSGFKKFGRTFLINLLLGIFSFLWSLLWIVPMVVVFLIIGVSAFVNGDVSPIIIVLIFIILLAFGISLQVFLNRYAMTYYICNDNDDIDVMESLKTSIELMKGKKIKYFILQLSFIGWGLLAVLTCGIGFLWLRPYIKATETCFYQEITDYQDNVEVIEL